MPAEELEELRARASTLPSLQISERAVCDLELLATGGFSPLDRFMGQADYERVLAEMRLADGTLFPIPVTLPVDAGRRRAARAQDVALRDANNDLLAFMTSRRSTPGTGDASARRSLGTADPRHPLVAEMQRWGPSTSPGGCECSQLPRHHDFQELRRTPAADCATRLASARPPRTSSPSRRATRCTAPTRS